MQVSTTLKPRKRAVELNPRHRMSSRGLRAKAWWIIRNRRDTTLENLLNTINDASQKDAESNIGKYLRALTIAGILKVQPTRAKGTALTSNGHYRYVLAIDCGEKAPVWRQPLKQIYCPSTGDIYSLVADSKEVAT